MGKQQYKLKIGFRLFIMLFICMGTTIIQAKAAEDDVKVFFKRGTLFRQQKDIFKPLDEEDKPKIGDTIRVGELADMSILQKDPSKLQTDALVLSYSKRDLITLSNGSTLVRTVSKEDEIPNFQLTGVARLFIRPDKQETEYNLNLNIMAEDYPELNKQEIMFLYQQNC